MAGQPISSVQSEFPLSPTKNPEDSENIPYPLSSRQNWLEELFINLQPPIFIPKREYKFINKILCFIGYHSWTWSLREHGMSGIKHSKCSRCNESYTKSNE